MGVHVHRNAFSMCAPALPYVPACLTVAARPPELRRRSGAFGRRRERPPLSGCLDRHRGGCACAHPCHPSHGGSLPSMESLREGCQSDAEAGDARPHGPRFGGRDRPRLLGSVSASGGNPVLDLIAYHDPGFHTVIRVWYYVAPAVAVVLAVSLCLSVWRVWLQPRARRRGRGRLPAWPTSPNDAAPRSSSASCTIRRSARERAALLARRSETGLYTACSSSAPSLRQDLGLHVSVRPAAPLVAGRPARTPGQRLGARGQGRLLPQVRQYDREHRPMRSHSIRKAVITM